MELRLRPGKPSIIIQTYAGRYTLWDVLHQTHTDRELTLMAMRLAERLQEIHEVGLVHCDLHSSNVVVNTPNDIRIIDLGYTRAAG